MISGHVAINKQCIALPSKKKWSSHLIVLMVVLGSISYSILIISDISFVLMFLVSIITGFAIVFSTLWFTCTNDVICEQLFTLFHINVTFYSMMYQHSSYRGIL